MGDRSRGDRRRLRQSLARGGQEERHGHARTLGGAGRRVVILEWLPDGADGRSAFVDGLASERPRLTRLRTFERRAQTNGATRGALQFEDLVLDRDAMECRRGERSIQLTRTEYLLLELFLTNPRKVLSRDVIFDRVWGYDFGPDSNSLDVYIGYLRRKLEAGGEPRVIQTVRGVGYVLKDA